jgi:cell division septum initiation protein DivIVA
VKKDYVKQLESANAELQRNLEEQGEIMDSLSAAFTQTRNEMKHYRMVVVCSDSQDIIKNGAVQGQIGDLVYTASLLVVPASQEEKQKVFEKYQISHNVRLSLFKSIKDRCNKEGSFYDNDMLNKYSKGAMVKPYVI